MRTPHLPLDLEPPNDAELGYLKQALRRSGKPYTDDDMLVLIAWLAQTQLAYAWLEEARAGRAALVVENNCVRLVANVPEPGGEKETSWNALT